MKKICLLVVFITAVISCFSQNPKVLWGSEFKASKEGTDLSVVSVDNSGVYMQESHVAGKGFFGYGVAGTLVKLDKNLSEQYRNDFNRELKGREFEQFFAFQNKLFIVSSDYSRKEKQLSLFIAEIDKNSGKISGDWQEIANWQKEEKNDNIDFKLSYNSDSTEMVIISSIEGTERNSYQIQLIDNNLKQKDPTVTITNEYDPKTFELEDLLYTPTKKIVAVGRIFEYEEGKKQKNKFRDFSKYSIRIYDAKGKQEKEINTDINGKWLVSSKIVQVKDQDLVLAAFYSNAKKGQDINGLLVQRIDPNTGNVVSTSQKEINTSLITTMEDDTDNGPTDNDKESKEEKKEREDLAKIKDDNEGFSKDMRFRKIFYTDDKGLVILAEKYHHYTYSSTTYTPGFNNMPGHWENTDYWVYECGDLMMCKIDVTGNINWLEVLPKQQREVYNHVNSYGGGFSYGSYIFDVSEMPYYSGFGALQNKNIINIFFNDDPRNAAVLQLGQKVKRVTYFRKSDCFSVVLDASTGKYTRTIAFSNNDIPTAMPRLGSIIGNDMYLVGKEDRYLGRAKIAVGKITVGK